VIYAGHLKVGLGKAGNECRCLLGRNTSENSHKANQEGFERMLLESRNGTFNLLHQGLPVIQDCMCQNL
jgi:hypothetical protein